MGTVGVWWAPLTFMANRLPRPTQECRLNRPSSAAQLQTRIEGALAGSPCLGRDRLSREPSFIVLHYAGPVQYHTAGLVEKNKVRWGHGPWGLRKTRCAVTAAHTWPLPVVRPPS